MSFTIFPGKRLKNLRVLSRLLSAETLPFKIFQGSNFPLLSVQSSFRSTAAMTIAFKSQFSFIEGGHVFASNLHEKQNKTKQNKKTRKETVKRFSLRKKKTKQNNNNKNRNIADSLLCLGLDASTTTVIREVVS